MDAPGDGDQQVVDLAPEEDNGSLVEPVSSELPIVLDLDGDGPDAALQILRPRDPKGL